MRPVALNADISRDAPGNTAISALPKAEQGVRLWTLLAPLLLILTTFVVIVVSKSETSERTAQFTGFAYYWTVGGIILPLIFLGRQEYAALFDRSLMVRDPLLRGAVIALFLPAAFGFLFAFPYLFPAESGLLLPGLALYALLNGTFEEVFWRGVFIRRFRDNPRLAVVYPSVLFGVWQLVPWALFSTWFHPSWFLLLAVAVSTGLLFGWVAWRTQSIRLTVMAHVLANLSGIGALIIFAPAS